MPKLRAELGRGRDEERGTFTGCIQRPKGDRTCGTFQRVGALSAVVWKWGGVMLRQ